eukprot:snap_masked-scaffold_11-processed-gene-12.53-mRNA-1 protein AED:1.00 eAED:1.00 QI:0/-1/0/0/-1/1/1/0/70
MHKATKTKISQAKLRVSPSTFLDLFLAHEIRKNTELLHPVLHETFGCCQCCWTKRRNIFMRTECLVLIDR